jgi:hypothetical protein
LSTHLHISPNTCCTQRQLLGYLDGSLNPADARDVELHFTDCQICSDALDGLCMLSADDRLELMNNKNPFTASSEQSLRVASKKNRIWQIAAAVFLLFGAGLAYQQWKKHGPEDDKTLATVQQEPATPAEVQKEMPVPHAIEIDSVSKDANNPQDNDVKFTPPISTNTVNCPPDPPAPTVAAINVQDDAKYLYENKAEEDVAMKDKIVAANELKESEKVIISETKKPVASVKNIYPAPVVDNNNNFNSNFAPTSNYTNTEQLSHGAYQPKDTKGVTIGGARSKNATYVVDGIATKTVSKKENKAPAMQGYTGMDGKLHSLQENTENELALIKSAFNNNNYDSVITSAEKFLQTKSGAYNTEAQYYLALSYDAKNNRAQAITIMMQLKNAKGKFGKLAKKQLLAWQEAK